MDIIGTYLTSSAVAPLNKEFIEVESPLWFVPSLYLQLLLLKIHSSYIYFGEDTRATYVDLPIYVGSVPAEHMYDFDEKLKKSLQKVVKEGMDMERMNMVINRDERQVGYCQTR